MAPPDQSNSSDMETNYCKVSEAMKLIPHTFDGDKNKLREFLDNVDTAFEITHINDHVMLLKFVRAKITGDARSKLMIKSVCNTWGSVKSILEDNFAIRRTIDYYACQMFSAKQLPQENIVTWASRIDNLQTQFREAAARSCENDDLSGALALIFMMGRACFTQGLFNERIQTIVRSRDGKMNFAQTVECAIEEESSLLSIKEKGYSQKREIRPSSNITCYHCGKIGHKAAKCFKKKTVLPTAVRMITQEGNRTGSHYQYSKPSNNVECHFCKKKGHYMRDCFKRKREIALREQTSEGAKNALKV